jgi:hypothetical protein
MKVVESTKLSITLKNKISFMPLSFYLIATAIFLTLSFFLYRATVKHLKKELSIKNPQFTITTWAMRGIVPISFVVTILIMLAVRTLFY